MELEKTGLQISALFRGYLNLIGLNWKDCEKWGEIFDYQVSNVMWLYTDNGTTFERSFVPKLVKERESVK